jgi:hypothetical protein
MVVQHTRGKVYYESAVGPFKLVRAFPTRGFGWDARRHAHSRIRSPHSADDTGGLLVFQWVCFANYTFATKPPAACGLRPVQVAQWDSGITGITGITGMLAVSSIAWSLKPCSCIKTGRGGLRRRSARRARRLWYSVSSVTYRESASCAASEAAGPLRSTLRKIILERPPTGSGPGGLPRRAPVAHTALGPQLGPGMHGALRAPCSAVHSPYSC